MSLAHSLPSFLAVGECMVEIAPAGDVGDDLFRRGFAGDTFNTAWYARHLLPRSHGVGYLTAIGDDDASEAMLAFMAASGIDTDHIARVPERTVGLYMIALEDGERSFSYWRSHSAARLLARHLPDPARAVREGGVVHVSGITLAILTRDDRALLLDWLARARSGGAVVSLDPNVRPRLWESTAAIREWIERAARVADIVLPSLDEEARDFGPASAGEDGAAAVAERYIGWGASTVVVKNGDAPGLVATAGGGRETFAPEPVVDVVDTTAAGDAFDAGFLTAMMQGEDLRACARNGAKVAAKVVGQRGALVRLDRSGG